jgi:peptidoglycan/LPS O-acetylase OafA/YrhL
MSAQCQDGSPAAQARLSYLDGLRGRACLQVVALHILSSYFPTFAEDPGRASIGGRIHHSPLLILYNGWAAVFVFFILSGYVLTRSFERHSGGVVNLIEARIARLWVPTLVFGIFSGAMYFAFGRSHTELGSWNHAGLLNCCWHIDRQMSSILRELIVTPVFVGYQGSPVANAFPILSSYLRNSGTALNSPVWTMSVELQGALLTLAFVALRRKHFFFWFLALFATIAFVPAFACFAVGHLAAVNNLGEKTPLIKGRLSFIAISTLIACGWYFSSFEGKPAYLFYGTSLIFFAVTQSTAIRSLLAKPIFQMLGHRSFTIYLVHWAVVLGFGSWVIVSLQPAMDWQVSRLIVAPIVLFVIVVLSGHLTLVDDFAVELSRAIKRGDSGSAAIVAIKSHFEKWRQSVLDRLRKAVPHHQVGLAAGPIETIASRGQGRGCPSSP